jgi:hypothetical protein
MIDRSQSGGLASTIIAFACKSRSPDVRAGGFFLSAAR